MIFNNGQAEIDVNEIDKLKDLSQEETNNLACGPQDAFFNKLDTVNNALTNLEIKNLDVNDKWNWKPGAYKIVRKYLLNRLQIDKKCQSLTKLIDRTRENINYTNYLFRQIREMEMEKSALKRLGVLKNVDIEEFKEKCIEFVKRIEEQCLKASEMTKGNVVINTFISDLETRVPRIYYNIVLNNLTLSIYDGDKMIQEIPLGEIRIIISQNLRTKLGTKSKDISLLGRYDDSELDEAKYPYISAGYSHTDYSTVCLDKHYDDVQNAIYKNDLVSLSFVLMQWAQYYHISHSNPYNQPSLLKFGMPGNYSDEYSATQSSSNVNSKSDDILRSRLKRLDLNYMESNEYYVECLDFIECKYRGLNNHYLRRKSNIELQDTDYYYKMESLIFLLLDNIMHDAHKPNSIWNISDDCSCIAGASISIGRNSYSENEQQITDIEETEGAVIWTLFNYFINKPFYNGFKIIDRDKHILDDMNPYDCKYVFEYLEKNNLLDDKKTEKPMKGTESINDADKMKELMKQWAYSSERSA